MKGVLSRAKESAVAQHLEINCVRDTRVNKARDCIGSGCRAGNNRAGGTQENCSGMGLKVVGFAGVGLVSWALSGRSL